MLNKNLIKAVFLLILGLGASASAVSEAYRLNYLHKQQETAINNINQELDRLEDYYQQELAVVNLNSPESLLNTIIDRANKKYWFLGLSRYRRILNKSIQKLTNFNADDFIQDCPELDLVLRRLACVKDNLKKIDQCLTQSSAFSASNKNHRGLVVLGIVAASIVLTIAVAPIIVVYIAFGTLPVYGISALPAALIPAISIASTVATATANIAALVLIPTISVTAIILLNHRLKELTVKKKAKFKNLAQTKFVYHN